MNSLFYKYSFIIVALYVFKEFPVESRMTHRFCISHNDELHSGTRYRHVHTSQVAQEANLSITVGSHERDDNDVALLSLKAVYGINGNQFAVRTEKLAPLNHTAK